jgi:hypothetical protein
LSEHGAPAGPDRRGTSVVPLSFPVVNWQAKTPPFVLVATQAPLEQALPAPQTCPQAPQLFGSERTLWQTVEPPHFACPTGQLVMEHTPLVQTAPPLQTCPQAPQLLGSERTLWQTVDPPHFAVPTAQLVMEHTPLVQTAPPLQTCPQAPQLLGSDRTLWQTVDPPHLACPTGQLMTEHWPLVQTPPAPRARPQAPQLFTSVWTFVQREPPHITCPVGQVCAREAPAPIAATNRIAEANRTSLAISRERMSVSPRAGQSAPLFRAQMPRGLFFDPSATAPDDGANPIAWTLALDP